VPVLGQRPRTLAPPAGIAPLAGYTVAVASDRRRHALAALLEAAGARTLGVQAVRAYSAADDPSVRAATRDALAALAPSGLRAFHGPRRIALAAEVEGAVAEARTIERGPRAGAPVSTPLRWDEVNESLDPSSFTMEVVLERVREHGDLFAGVLSTRQRIDRALEALR